ncbi:hypothetical protein [Brachybacterium alimentarium]|uniref:hypothetical protein n=1 Tax=Brachybacterium alimentarium TaxID=47845 RepID=UPI003FD08426
MDDRKVHWDQNVTDPDDDIIDAEIVEDDEPINVNTETGIMSIGGNPALANATSSTHLPSALDTIYELSRLAPEAIESGIESGDVHPGMTIKDAKGYAAEATARDLVSVTDVTDEAPRVNTKTPADLHKGPHLYPPPPPCGARRVH